MNAPLPEPTPTLSDQQRERFDALLEDAIEALPVRICALLDEVPVIVLDCPTAEMVGELIRDGLLEAGENGLDLCGLHTGTGLTERSVEDHGTGPEHIHLFRIGIADLVGAWTDEGFDDGLYEEIRITLLHEIGHHFGLDEDQLDELGYA